MIINTIKKFTQEHTYGVVINEATDSALLFINPEFETLDGDNVMVKFESFSENQGSSIIVCGLIEDSPDKISLETDDNVLTIRPLNLETYNIYIAEHYFGSKKFTDKKDLFEAIGSQLKELT